MGANIEGERNRKYHLEATLIMSRTLPLYMLSLTSFPCASCKQEQKNISEISEITQKGAEAGLDIHTN